MDIFNRALAVIGPHGAGLSNLLFSEPGTLVLEGLCYDYWSTPNLCYRLVHPVTSSFESKLFSNFSFFGLTGKIWDNIIYSWIFQAGNSTPVILTLIILNAGWFAISSLFWPVFLAAKITDKTLTLAALGLCTKVKRRIFLFVFCCLFFFQKREFYVVSFFRNLAQLLGMRWQGVLEGQRCTKTKPENLEQPLRIYLEALLGNKSKWPHNEGMMSTHTKLTFYVGRKILGDKQQFSLFCSEFSFRPRQRLLTRLFVENNKKGRCFVFSDFGRASPLQGVACYLTLEHLSICLSVSVEYLLRKTWFLGRLATQLWAAFCFWKINSPKFFFRLHLLAFLNDSWHFEHFIDPA